MITLESEIRILLAELKNLELKYKDKKHQDRDQICESMYRSRAEAYGYCAKKIEDIFKWLGVEK